MDETLAPIQGPLLQDAQPISDAQAASLRPTVGDFPTNIPSASLLDGESTNPPNRTTRLQDIQQEIQNITGQLGGIQSQANQLTTQGTPPTTFTTPSGLQITQQPDGTFIDGTGTPIGTRSIADIQTPPPPTTRTGILEGIRDFFTGQSSIRDIGEGLLPEIPAELIQVDQELATLRNQFEQAREVSENRQAPTFAIVGEQAALDRQFAIRENTILRRRDAIQGNYDRALDRAKLIIGLEQEDREAQRQQQRLAIDVMLSEANFEDSLILQQFKTTLDQQAQSEQRAADRKEADLNTIREIISSNPEAFQNTPLTDLPKTVEEAQAIAGGFAAPIIESQRSRDIRAQEADITNIQSETAKRLAESNPPSGSEQGRLKAVIDELPIGQQGAAFEAIGVFKDSSNILTLLGDVSTGPLSGFLGSLESRLQDGDVTPTAFEEFKAASVGFTAGYIKALSGVQVSDKERQFLLGLLPTVNKQESENRAGILTAISRLQNLYELKLGIDFDDFPIEIPNLEDVEVIEKSTGQRGTVSMFEFDDDIYELVNP